MGIRFNPLIFTGFDNSGSGGGGAPNYKAPVANAAALPLVGNTDGDVRVTLDTDEVYVWNEADARWVNVGLTATTIVGSTPNSSGYVLLLDDSIANLRYRQLQLEPADATHPGIVSTSGQVFGGVKTFTDDLHANGGLDLNNQLIENVANPVSNQDAATKYYVDEKFAHVDTEAIYVDPNNGSDTSGTGSIIYPYASINKAISVCTNPSSRYVIMLGPGVFTGATVNWLPNVDLMGSGTSSSISQQISYVASPGDIMACSFSNVEANNMFFNFDSGSVGLPVLYDGTFGVQRSDSQGSGPWAIRINDATITGLDVTGSNLVSNCLFVGSCSVQNGSTLICSIDTIGILVNLYGTASINLTGCTVPGTLNGITVGIDVPTVRTDASSITSATLVNMTVVLTDSATYVSYDNTDSGLAATTVKDAIDELSALASINKKELFILSPTDITNQYIDLTQVAKIDSVFFDVQGGSLQVEGSLYDYTVSYTGGAGSKTRITFQNGLATGGVSELISGDIVAIQYEYY